jgi:hypothetical protein
MTDRSGQQIDRYRLIRFLGDWTVAMLSFLCEVEIIFPDEGTVSAKNSIVTR